MSLLFIKELGSYKKQLVIYKPLSTIFLHFFKEIQLSHLLIKFWMNNQQNIKISVYFSVEKLVFLYTIYSFVQLIHKTKIIKMHSVQHLRQSTC